MRTFYIADENNIYIVKADLMEHETLNNVIMFITDHRVVAQFNDWVRWGEAGVIERKS